MKLDAALADDLPELRDVMFALDSTRDIKRAPRKPRESLLGADQTRRIRADSRARAWIPPHLLASLR